MKTNLDEINTGFIVDDLCTDEFFDKIYFDAKKTFQFLYSVSIMYDRLDLIQKHKNKINFNMIDNMNIQMLILLEPVLDSILKIKEGTYEKFD